MSYQQYPPAGGSPVVQQPAAPFAAAPQQGGRKPGLVAVGALLLAAGVVAGIVLFLAGSSNYDEGVKNLARAPIGCTTTLEFDEAGTYYVYLETRGTIGELRGDCPNADTDYDSTGDDLPDVDIVLVNDDGDEIDLDDDDSKDYDAAGFVGRSVASVQIDDAGDYELTATSDEDEVVVAVGRTPADDASTLQTMGIAALVAGLLVGGLLLVLGLRRGKPAPGAGAPPASYAPAPAGYPPSGQIPVTPPTATYPAQPVPPSYQPPAYQPPTQPLPPTAPPPPPSPPPTAPPTIPAPPAPPGSPPSGGPSWPAPPST